MEAALTLWIVNCRKKAVRLDIDMSRTKAKTLYDQILPCDDDEEAEESADEPQPNTSAAKSESPPQGPGFSASKGWFEKFQNHYGLRSIPLYGEAFSADNDGARRYVEEEFAQDIDDNMPCHQTSMLLTHGSAFFERRRKHNCPRKPYQKSNDSFVTVSQYLNEKVRITSTLKPS
ncbi:tigger transposable element-derived protein 1-like [Syngnathoides biaculeatus]|uniref:tigger transposable element-derived protein 1-like n=1 Tax=Syngnathoides biaculeatus TaxID=300417 RepID=UPI002ADD8754|nr:tigger transposable element-derived protein 1-like [Syngnathoides biaculeatus]